MINVNGVLGKVGLYLSGQFKPFLTKNCIIDSAYVFMMQAFKPSEHCLLYINPMGELNATMKNIAAHWRYLHFAVQNVHVKVLE